MTLLDVHKNYFSYASSANDCSNGFCVCRFCIMQVNYLFYVLLFLLLILLSGKGCNILFFSPHLVVQGVDWHEAYDRRIVTGDTTIVTHTSLPGGITQQ